MIQPIYLYGSEVLRAPAAEADLENKEYLTGLITDLKDTLKKSDGCGLAAPQVGESVQLVVIDVDYGDDADPNPYVLINPKIIVADGEERTAPSWPTSTTTSPTSAG